MNDVSLLALISNILRFERNGCSDSEDANGFRLCIMTELGVSGVS
jgi:hypothetical protein